MDESITPMETGSRIIVFGSLTKSMGLMGLNNFYCQSVCRLNILFRLDIFFWLWIGNKWEEGGMVEVGG
jgi:hypothetical protein